MNNYRLNGIICIFLLLLLSFQVFSQKGNGISTLQGYWKTITDENAIVIWHIEGNKLKERYFYENGYEDTTYMSKDKVEYLYPCDECGYLGNKFNYKINTEGNGEYLAILDDSINTDGRCYEYGIDEDTLYLLYRTGGANSFIYTRLILDSISVNKSIVYSSPDIVTKMYLEKGNEVEILEEKGEWLHIIRYYGKKIIEGWIKKED